ncbi:MAG: hypothetical protein ABEJ58_00070 [Halodesulfurarchaeum sp.]
MSPVNSPLPGWEQEVAHRRVLHENSSVSTTEHDSGVSTTEHDSGVLTDSGTEPMHSPRRKQG